MYNENKNRGGKQARIVFGRKSTPTLGKWCNDKDAAERWWNANLLRNFAGVLFQVIKLLSVRNCDV